MLSEIINELTKAEKNANVTSKQVLAWAKRVEAKRAKSAVINCLNEMKVFDKFQTARDEQKENGRKPQIPVKMPTKQNCKYCGSSHQLRQWPAFEKKCMKCNKMNHF